MNQDQMYIKIEYSLASLFGSIDPEAEKINAQESAHQFKPMRYWMFRTDRCLQENPTSKLVKGKCNKS